MEPVRADSGGADPAESETPSISAEVELEANEVELELQEVDPEDSDENPWPYLRDYFGFRSRNGHSCIMQCKLCLPRHTELAAYKNSTSNLRKHVERIHPLKLKAFSDFVATRKRNLEPPETLSKLAKISDVMPVGANRRLPQAKVNKLMINFVCEGLHPFSLVEQPAFKELLLTLNPQCKVMSRSTLRTRIEGAAYQMKKNLMSHLCKVCYFATTVDCWAAHQQSYILVTTHWVDQESFKRKSAALACQRLKGSLTFDVLAGALEEIHRQYRIRGRVVRITTDNGSNFSKSFSVFGERSDPEDAESESDQESSEEPKADYVDTFSILEQDSSLDYQLPSHHRCACHLLNLVATADAAVAEEKNDTYKRLSRGAFGKCQAIWNKSGRSYMAAEIVEDLCKLQLVRPNQGRWNSIYMAVERIVQIVQEKGESSVRHVCEEFGVKM